MSGLFCERGGLATQPEGFELVRVIELSAA